MHNVICCTCVQTKDIIMHIHMITMSIKFAQQCHCLLRDLLFCVKYYTEIVDCARERII